MRRGPLATFLVYAAVKNAADNLARAKIASGFGFWNNTAGFDISQTLIEYSAQTSSYGQAFWVGLTNTLLVAIVGISRLSKNWLLARVATGYVELIRNLPLLLQLLFWYNAVLKALPELRDSLVIPGGFFLNNRGLFLPAPVFAPAARFALIALVLGIVAAFVYRAVNTADAMIGYREGLLGELGWATARLDDLLNLLPSRLGALAVVAGAGPARESATGAWRAWRRDGRLTESPNAGQTMAAMAGALHVTLEKHEHYRLGAGAPPDVVAIDRSVRVFAAGAGLALVAALVVLRAWR